MKTLSEQAQVAKLIRQFCKGIGVKCQARSDSFSMGDSVDWTVYDQPPAIYKQISDYASQFQYGHFNGMEDIYEYSNSRDGIPQTKYCHGRNEFSDEIQQAAWDIIRVTFSDAIGAPEDYKKAGNVRIGNDWASTTVYRFLNGSLDMTCANFTPSADFWKSRESVKVETVKPETVTVDSLTIREGTKPGFSEVLFPAKPEQSVIDKLKAAGYRWSSFNKVWYGKTENLPITV